MSETTASVRGAAEEGMLPGDPGRRGGITPVSLFVVLLVGYVLVQVQFILVLILVSLVLATALDRPVTLLQKRLGLHRGIVILGLYITFFGLIYLAGFLVAPLVRDQIDIFIAEAPLRLNEVRADWQSSSNNLLNGTGQQLLGNAINALDNPPDPQQATALTVLTGAIGGIIGIFATLVITFYYLMERAFIRQLLLNEVSPRTKQRVARIWDEGEAKVGGWLRGQLTLCLIIGLLSAIGYGIIGVPFWPILAIWAGITEIIPVLGPWLGGIPAVILALSVDTTTGLIVIGYVVGLQMLENWVLVPRVMRGAVGLTPLTVFVAITVGAEFYGIIGTLIAIPLAAFVQVVITALMAERRVGTAPRPTRTIPAWRWMRVSSQNDEQDGYNGDRSPTDSPESNGKRNGNGGDPGSATPSIPGRGGRATPSTSAPSGSAPPTGPAPLPAPATTNATATEVRPISGPPLGGGPPTTPAPPPPNRAAASTRPSPASRTGSTPAPRPGAQTGPRWSPEHLARNTGAAPAPGDQRDAAADQPEPTPPPHRAIGTGEAT